jgi:hypothetical protein
MYQDDFWIYFYYYIKSGVKTEIEQLLLNQVKSINPQGGGMAKINKSFTRREFIDRTAKGAVGLIG